MRNRIFEIVALLIDCMQGDGGQLLDTNELRASLQAQGYSEVEISSAYSWLVQRIENTPQPVFSAFRRSRYSCRVLSPAESSQLTTPAHGFLIKLMNRSLIDDEQFENIMDRVFLSGHKPVDLDQMKFIVSSVVFDEFDAFTPFDADEDHSRSVN